MRAMGPQVAVLGWQGWVGFVAFPGLQNRETWGTHVLGDRRIAKSNRRSFVLLRSLRMATHKKMQGLKPRGLLPVFRHDSSRALLQSRLVSCFPPLQSLDFIPALAPNACKDRQPFFVRIDARQSQSEPRPGAPMFVAIGPRVRGFLG